MKEQEKRDRIGQEKMHWWMDYQCGQLGLNSGGGALRSCGSCIAELSHHKVEKGGPLSPDLAPHWSLLYCPAWGLSELLGYHRDAASMNASGPLWLLGNQMGWVRVSYISPLLSLFLLLPSFLPPPLSPYLFLSLPLFLLPFLPFFKSFFLSFF